MITLQDCQQQDLQDPLGSLRDLFDIPEALVYLDGNSLGALPRSTATRIARTVQHEWGQGLIRSWNQAGWFDLPHKVGDKIAQLIGAASGEVVAADSTSINLYKVLSAALNMAGQDHPTRRIVLSERSNFPTDLYIAESLCKERGMRLQLVEPEDLLGALNSDIAVLMLTHVNYRTGAMHDMQAFNVQAKSHGALTIWDLAHSAGAVPLELKTAQADFAVGCGYKYLNGGPGAPAFVWVNPLHTDRFWQPLSGWWGHATPFEFTPDYRPAAGITRYQCGTQAMLSLVGLDCGVDTLLAAQALGGMNALRKKSLALSDLFIALVEQNCQGHGLRCVTPLEHSSRGSQVCLARDEGAYAIVQALIARQVIGDFRAGDGGTHPDILRFGLTPLYVGFVDVWNAVDQLRQVLQSGEWQEPQFNQIQIVT
ncbi:MAG: kynureninase [Betaproteobacteria bacterium]|jgi:kynureninase|nr:kynureninase [Burkholderiales bacterium]NBX14616.1 kynureninase [Betaproteobacteria bacterium]NBX90046.1 kynureninase [Betaproteobacteria bacterium]